LSPFSTYKYHLGAWVKTQQQGQQTLEFSLKCFSFLLYIIFKTVVFIRFGDPSLHSIGFDGLLYLGRETHLIRNTYMYCVLYIYLALCRRGVFSLRIALCVPQPRIFLLLTSYPLFIIIIITIVDLWLIFIVLYIVSVLLLI